MYNPRFCLTWAMNCMLDVKGVENGVRHELILAPVEGV